MKSIDAHTESIASIAEASARATPKNVNKLLAAGSVVVVLLNGLITLALLEVPEGYSAAKASGAVTGALASVVILPLIVVGLFQIGRGFRNWASRVKVFFWASCVILVSKFANLLSPIQPG